MSRSSDWKHGSILNHDLWHPELIKNLPYEGGFFNDDDQVANWVKIGHQPRTGYLFDNKLISPVAEMLQLPRI